MVYQTYTTRAIVCGSKPSNTSDRSYLLFTESAGMLFATARSVREERSKQRYALQDFGSVRVSLVKGKGGWRIGSVEAERNPFLEARSRSERAYITGIVALLRRYIHGEEALPSVFADVVAALDTSVLVHVPDYALTVFEARLLYVLGHLEPRREIKAVLEAPDLSEALTRYTDVLLASLKETIHQAHHQSQL